MSKVKVVFIASTAHSGSTLLDLILGSHPRIFGLGELKQLEKRLPRICGICNEDCRFWLGSASTRILLRHCSRGLNIRSLMGEACRYQRSIYAYLAEWFGYSILVDSSKYPAWIRRQLRYRRHRKEMTPFLLHLTRDGRAVINSHIRKYPERGVKKITEEWIRLTKEILNLYEGFDGPRYRVAYEDLASRPDETISEICRFLGVDYVPSMLSFWEHEHHNIDGNAGTRSLIASKNKPVVKPGVWHNGYYDNMGRAIKLDLRWKEELAANSLEYFEKHAGDLNRSFRYD